MPEFKPINKEISSSPRLLKAKIQESTSLNNQRSKVKFKLETFEPLKALESLGMDPIMQGVTDTYQKLRPLRTENNELRCSIYNILSRDEFLRELLVPHIKGSARAKEASAAFAAAILRINRFRLKWLVVWLLHENSPKPNIAISHKLELLDKELSSTYIHLNLNKLPPQGPAITVESSLSLLAKHLTSFELQLKTLLPGLAMSHYVAPAPTNLIFDQQIFDNLTEIAPDGFIGLEGDYYYICRLLIGHHALPFDAAQRKQWDSYYEEIRKVFPLYLIPGLSCDFNRLMQHHNTINLPFTAFLAQEKLSANTYSRLVNALTVFTLNVWIILLIALLNKYMFPKSIKQ